MPSETQADSLLLVVLDCVRAADLADTARMPFLASLARHCVRFSGAVTPSPWTLPSHASLFTGRYPWEHGTHAKASMVLDRGAPQIASVLGREGFATASFSANFLISPSFGLVEGVDRALWGRWWDPYLRSPGSAPLGSEGGRARTLSPILRRAREGPFWGCFQRASSLLMRYPGLLDTLLRARRGIDPGGGRHNWAPAPWIEQQFESWVTGLPADRRLYAFVNLLDAHEPYFSDPEVVRSLGERWAYLRQRQDRMGWVAGRWSAEPGELDLLHKLYLAAIRAMDRRIGDLVNTLRRAGRWENTLLVITSDHGQAFGEHGALFHMLRVDEPLLRVPLWVRFPGSEFAGREVEKWVSLVDVAPTLYEAAGVPAPASLSGRSLRPNRPSLEAERPVLAMADGLGPEQASTLSARRKQEVDHVLVAAYQGRLKVVHDLQTGGTRAFDIVSDPGERHNVWRSTGADLRPLERLAHEVALALNGQKPVRMDASTQARLRSWGYA